MDVNDLLKSAITETETLASGEVLLLKALLKGHVWNRIAVKDRLLLGMWFLNDRSNTNLWSINKTSSHQQKYQKDQEIA